MHANSLRLMQEFLIDHVKPWRTTGRVLDVGAYNVNGCYRPLWAGWDYTGLDQEAGPNVDLVVPDGQPFPGGDYDVVISGQCLEHAKRPWELCDQMGRMLKPGGLLCLIAPFMISVHRYPIDCWRILPDGMRVLLEEYGGCDLLSAVIYDCFPLDGNGPNLMMDTMGVGRRRR